jgi:hypothetical protein
MTTWAVVLAVAMALEGEAGVLGAPGMYLVADSMLARLESPEHPDEWEGVLDAYYASAPPSSSALAIAARAVTSPWESRGMPYCVSREDAARLGLRVDEWYCQQDTCLGLAREWERETCGLQPPG